MTFLIDPHTFLWFINDSPQLSVDAKNLLEADVDLLLSVASLWEIAIKVSYFAMKMDACRLCPKSVVRK